MTLSRAEVASGLSRVAETLVLAVGALERLAEALHTAEEPPALEAGPEASPAGGRAATGTGPQGARP